MPDRVVDASAIAAILFTEDGATGVLDALRGHALYAPTVLEYELTNAAWKRTRRFPHRAHELEQALDGLWRLPLTFRRVERQAVLRIAVSSGITAYDASYLWLARQLGAPLVTLDRKLGAIADRR